MDIGETRKAIDKVDDAILDFLIQRHGLSQQLAEEKRRLSLPIYDPEREASILQRLTAANNQRLDPQAIVAIWREIFSSSRQAQQPVRVAYLGPEGTFTHQAALMRFGSSAALVASSTIAAAFTWVANRTVDYAILPVENTMHGIVGETVDLLGAAKQPLIVGELILPIHFVFSSKQENLENITAVYSKNEAFLQCSAFLSQPALVKARHLAVASTAEAARRAAEEPESGALSSEIAATQAGVPILYHHVENNTGNKTRFLVLGHGQQPPSGNDKTSIFAKVPNVLGGLENLLRSFRENGINLTKIESRPIDAATNFETWFYIDMEGHAAEPRIAAMFAANDLVLLGSYRRSP